MACEIKISFKFQGYGAHCSEWATVGRALCAAIEYTERDAHLLFTRKPLAFKIYDLLAT